MSILRAYEINTSEKCSDGVYRHKQRIELQVDEDERWRAIQRVRLNSVGDLIDDGPWDEHGAITAVKTISAYPLEEQIRIVHRMENMRIQKKDGFICRSVLSFGARHNGSELVFCLRWKHALLREIKFLGVTLYHKHCENGWSDYDNQSPESWFNERLSVPVVPENRVLAP